jgi:hypothetical protein
VSLIECYLQDRDPWVTAEQYARDPALVHELLAHLGRVAVIDEQARTVNVLELDEP